MRKLTLLLVMVLGVSLQVGAQQFVAPTRHSTSNVDSTTTYILIRCLITSIKYISLRLELTIFGKLVRKLTRSIVCIYLKKFKLKWVENMK